MKRIMAATIAMIPALAIARDFQLAWNTIDGGGGRSNGGTYVLDGTIGQPDAQTPPVMSGGTYEVTGGFWAIAELPHPADMNCDGTVNNFDIDGFVMALTSPAAYHAAYPNCNIENGDVNTDGLVNNFDIDGFVACVIHSGCP